jgi:hypothetical protein
VIEADFHSPELFSASHWERGALADEIMTASHIGDLEISKFTLALLKDTNWYKEINLDKEDTMFFGKNRGCSFV